MPYTATQTDTDCIHVPMFQAMQTTSMYSRSHSTRVLEYESLYKTCDITDLLVEPKISPIPNGSRTSMVPIVAVEAPALVPPHEL